MTYNDPSHQNAKRVTHSIAPKVAKHGYRSQKGRKYNAKHRAASARWTEGKGFQTRQDKLENPKDLTKDPTSGAYQAPPTPTTGPANEQELRSRTHKAHKAPDADQAPSANEIVSPSTAGTAGTAGLGFIPEIPEIPEPQDLMLGCQRRVFKFPSGRCFESATLGGAEVEILAANGKHYDNSGAQVLVMSVAAMPAYNKCFPAPVLNEITGNWEMFKPPAPSEPTGPSAQKYGSTQRFQPAQDSGPACKPPHCSCKTRVCPGC